MPQPNGEQYHPQTAPQLEGQIQATRPANTPLVQFNKDGTVTSPYLEYGGGGEPWEDPYADRDPNEMGNNFLKDAAVDTTTGMAMSGVFFDRLLRATVGTKPMDFARDAMKDPVKAILTREGAKILPVPQWEDKYGTAPLLRQGDFKKIAELGGDLGSYFYHKRWIPHVNATAEKTLQGYLKNQADFNWLQFRKYPLNYIVEHSLVGRALGLGRTTATAGRFAGRMAAATATGRKIGRGINAVSKNAQSALNNAQVPFAKYVPFGQHILNTARSVYLSNVLVRKFNKLDNRMKDEYFQWSLRAQKAWNNLPRELRNVPMLVAAEQTDAHIFYKAGMNTPEVQEALTVVRDMNKRGEDILGLSKDERIFTRIAPLHIIRDRMIREVKLKEYVENLKTDPAFILAAAQWQKLKAAMPPNTDPRVLNEMMETGPLRMYIGHINELSQPLEMKDFQPGTPGFQTIKEIYKARADSGKALPDYAALASMAYILHVTSEMESKQFGGQIASSMGKAARMVAKQGLKSPYELSAEDKKMLPPLLNLRSASKARKLPLRSRPAKAGQPQGHDWSESYRNLRGVIYNKPYYDPHTMQWKVPKREVGPHETRLDKLAKATLAQALMYDACVEMIDEIGKMQDAAPPGWKSVDGIVLDALKKMKEDGLHTRNLEDAIRTLEANPGSLRAPQSIHTRLNRILRQPTEPNALERAIGAWNKIYGTMLFGVGNPMFGPMLFIRTEVSSAVSITSPKDALAYVLAGKIAAQEEAKEVLPPRLTMSHEAGRHGDPHTISSMTDASTRLGHVLDFASKAVYDPHNWQRRRLLIAELLYRGKKGGPPVQKLVKDFMDSTAALDEAVIKSYDRAAMRRALKPLTGLLGDYSPEKYFQLRAVRTGVPLIVWCDHALKMIRHIPVAHPEKTKVIVLLQTLKKRLETDEQGHLPVKTANGEDEPGETWGGTQYQYNYNLNPLEGGTSLGVVDPAELLMRETEIEHAQEQLRIPASLSPALTTVQEATSGMDAMTGRPLGQMHPYYKHSYKQEGYPHGVYVDTRNGKVVGEHPSPPTWLLAAERTAPGPTRIAQYLLAKEQNTPWNEGWKRPSRWTRPADPVGSARKGDEMRIDANNAYLGALWGFSEHEQYPGDKK